MSNIVRNAGKDSHVAKSHFSNMHRAFQYNDHHHSLSSTDFRPHKHQFMAGPSTTAKRRGKIMGNLDEYPDSLTWNYVRDKRGDDDAYMREDSGLIGFFKNLIDPIALVKEMRHYMVPSSIVESKFGGNDNTGVVYAYDLPYVGSGMIMGQRDTPMLYHHDIIDQRPDHYNYQKTNSGLKAYADNLLRRLPYSTEKHRRGVYLYIDKLTENKKLLRKSTNIELKGHVHKFIQTYDPETKAIKHLLYKNTI